MQMMMMMMIVMMIGLVMNEMARLSIVNHTRRADFSVVQHKPLMIVVGAAGCDQIEAGLVADGRGRVLVCVLDDFHIVYDRYWNGISFRRHGRNTSRRAILLMLLLIIELFDTAADAFAVRA